MPNLRAYKKIRAKAGTPAGYRAGLWGQKIRSRGKGRGLGIGRGKGAIGFPKPIHTLPIGKRYKLE